MASSSNDRRRANRASRTSRGLSGNGRSRRSGKVHTTPEHKPLQQRDTGYRVGRGKTSSRREGLSGMIRDPRMIIVGIAGLVVLGVLIFGISSCVRGCSASNRAKEEGNAEKKVNAIDARVSADASEELTAKFSDALDQADALDDVAAHADKIDETLIDLALAEPQSVTFVKGSLDSDGSTTAYDEAVTKGTIPLLYDWDERWGYASYAEGMAGVTASGPLSLSMAAMGLSGKTTNDPATVMKAVEAAKLAKGATGMDDTFVTQHAGEVGLSAEALEVSADSIATAFYGESPLILARIKASSAIGAADAHWALVTTLNQDGSYTVHDPTSYATSTHTWAAGTIAAASDALYQLGTASSDTAGDAGSADEGEPDAGYDEYTEYDAEGNPIG